MCSVLALTRACTGTNKVINGLYDKYSVSDVVLGEGAFGIVKKGFCKRTNEAVAIKIVHKETMSRKEIRGIRQEIDILKSLCHKNIVRLYDSYETDKQFFLVMEFINGSELFDLIVDETNTFSEKEIRKIMKELCEALLYARDRGIIHRDLKPNNVMVNENGVIKLIDFNMSYKMDVDAIDFSIMQTLCGTTTFLAPEVASGKAYSSKCDVWSLGVILYCLTSGGFLPFFTDVDGENGEIDLFDMVRCGKWSFKPAAVWENVSNEIKDLIKNMLTKKVDKRFCYEQILAHEWMKSNSSELLNNKGTPEKQQTIACYKRELLTTSNVYSAIKIFESLMKEENDEIIIKKEEQIVDNSSFFENDF